VHDSLNLWVCMHGCGQSSVKSLWEVDFPLMTGSDRRLMTPKSLLLEL
jgi:hypothetical protein